MLAITLLSLSAPPSDTTAAAWLQYKTAHNKQYPSLAEEAKRLEAFAANVAAVAERGLEWESALASPYADLTPAEFNVRNGYQAVRRGASSVMHKMSAAPKLPRRQVSR